MIFQIYYSLHYLFGEKKFVIWFLNIQANVILNLIFLGNMSMQQSAIIDNYEGLLQFILHA